MNSSLTRLRRARGMLLPIPVPVKTAASRAAAGIEDVVSKTQHLDFYQVANVAMYT